jgi:predicted HTH transcriptional regulator
MTEAKQQAYINGIVSGEFDNNSQKIYNLLKVQPNLTTEFIYKFFGKQRNELSGRITDLLDAGLIKEVSSGKYTLLTISEPHERNLLQRQRTELKIRKWVKCGEALGLDFTYRLK